MSVSRDQGPSSQGYPGISDTLGYEAAALHLPTGLVQELGSFTTNGGALLSLVAWPMLGSCSSQDHQSALPSPPVHPLIFTKGNQEAEGGSSV